MLDGIYAKHLVFLGCCSASFRHRCWTAQIAFSGTVYSVNCIVYSTAAQPGANFTIFLKFEALFLSVGQGYTARKNYLSFGIVFC